MSIRDMLIYMSNKNMLMLPDLTVLSTKFYVSIFSHSLSVCILLTGSWIKTIRQKNLHRYFMVCR